MRLLSSLSLLVPFLWVQLLTAQSNTTTTTTSPASLRSLDALLQDYAYRAFVRPRTGISYPGLPPSNLTGIEISALRLRSGSLRIHGVESYQEFEIPIGVIVEPYIERLVLVYQNLDNWTDRYYSLPGYTYLTPVLGLLAYDASNLSAKNLPELSIKASDKPILIKFTQVKSTPGAKCVWFDLDGLPEFSNVSLGNVCSTREQGHFAIVVESKAPAPAPVFPPPTGEGPKPPSGGGHGGGGKKNSKKVLIIVGAAVGGFALLVLLSLLACCLRKYKKKNKMQKMEKAAEVGESLNMASVGNTRAPVAMWTRTQPVLENEYVP